MNRYTVYHQAANGKDGDAGFDDLAKAEAEYDHQCQQRHVIMVELLDNADIDNPVTLRSWNARETTE